MMKTCSLTSLIVVFAMTSVSAAGPEDAVVRVTATRRFPNVIRPWTRLGPSETAGSGVVIAGNRILTCAHLVSYARDVTVQGRDGGRRVDARVEVVGPGIDLAILTPLDPDFLANRPPVPRATDLPDVMAPVLVYGYPVGGNGLSVTRGIVSRIGYGPYEGGTLGLHIQVDAAINPGNSGGPALVEGKMVGLASSRLVGTQGISFILPSEEIDTFLDDIKDGRYDGKPQLSSEYQPVENEALRARLGLERDAGGMMIRRPAPDGAGPLRELDVLTQIGDRPIDREGMIQARDSLRLPFLYLVTKLERSGAVPVRLWRDGHALEIALPVGHDDNALIRDLDGRDPAYFVFGPLVLSPVVAETAEAYFQLNPSLITRSSPILARAVDHVRFPGEELVAVTTPLFPHRVARGYDDPIGQVVESVNGVAIRNLGHLVELLRDARDEYVTFRFAEDHAETLVFRRKEMEAATAEVLSENGIPRRGTPDVMAVWENRSSSSR
jgi:S1-C subfamily serine protease